MEELANVLFVSLKTSCQHTGSHWQIQDLPAIPMFFRHPSTPPAFKFQPTKLTETSLNHHAWGDCSQDVAKLHPQRLVLRTMTWHSCRQHGRLLLLLRCHLNIPTLRNRLNQHLAELTGFILADLSASIGIPSQDKNPPCLHPGKPHDSDNCTGPAGPQQHLVPRKLQTVQGHGSVRLYWLFGNMWISQRSIHNILPIVAHKVIWLRVNKKINVR